jgi:hypothetical protein
VAATMSRPGGQRPGKNLTQRRKIIDNFLKPSKTYKKHKHSETEIEKQKETERFIFRTTFIPDKPSLLGFSAGVIRIFFALEQYRFCLGVNVQVYVQLTGSFGKSSGHVLLSYQ